MQSQETRYVPGYRDGQLQRSMNYNDWMKIKKGYCASEFGEVLYWRAGSGPVLLLLHPASQSSEEFSAIAPILANRYTVLSLDYPGHSRSGDPAEELSVQDFSAVIIAVLDFFAEEPEQLRNCIAGNEFVSIQGGGPFLFHEKPAQCAEVISDFLDQ